MTRQRACERNSSLPLPPSRSHKSCRIRQIVQKASKSNSPNPRRQSDPLGPRRRSSELHNPQFLRTRRIHLESRNSRLLINPGKALLELLADFRAKRSRDLGSEVRAKDVDEGNEGGG